VGDIWKSAEENPDEWIAVFTAQHKEPVSADQHEHVSASFLTAWEQQMNWRKYNSCILA